MRHVLRVIGGIARPALVQGACPAATGMRAETVEHAGRRDHRAWDVGDLRQPEVHLEEGETDDPSAP